MDWWERAKIGGGVALACGTLAAGFWLAGLIVGPVYPRQQGYAIEGVPPVDLAAAQREWPVGDEREERQQLIGYISNIERAAVPIVPAAVAAPAEAPVDLPTLLASADPQRGRRAAQTCMACHDMSANGPNRIGPNLWGVVGRPVASHAGFTYSGALRTMGGDWTYQQLDHFLASPARAAPGTKMSFAGVRNPRERANLLAYLATVGAGPPPPITAE